MRPWRLVLDGRRRGAENMALDGAILAAHVEGRVPPTLRIYGWSPPAVSLGRFQREADVDAAACRRRGLDVVRRPTGGRGVLHDDEVTYSVVAGVSDGVPRGTAASYRHLCAGLAEAYRLLGVPAELTTRPRGSSGSGACYLHATQADMSLGAAKLSGSAQVWSGSSVLQHGSFVISRDVEAEAEVFRLSAEAAEDLRRGTATLASVLGRVPGSDEIADAIARGMATALGLEFEAAGLSDEEIETSSLLRPEHVVEGSDSAQTNRQDDV